MLNELYRVLSQDNRLRIAALAIFAYQRSLMVLWGVSRRGWVFETCGVFEGGPGNVSEDQSVSGQIGSEADLSWTSNYVVWIVY